MDTIKITQKYEEVAELSVRDQRLISRAFETSEQIDPVELDYAAAWETIDLVPEVPKLVRLIDHEDETLRDLHSAATREWLLNHARFVTLSENVSISHLIAAYNERDHGGAWQFSIDEYWADALRSKEKELQTMVNAVDKTINDILERTGAGSSSAKKSISKVHSTTRNELSDLYGEATRLLSPRRNPIKEEVAEGV